MQNHTFVHLLWLLSICAFTHALPPIILPSLNSLLNATNANVKFTHNNTLHAFPPYPPPDPYTHPLPSSNLSLTFSFYRLDHSRSEQDVREVLAQAAYEAAEQEDLTLPMPIDTFYEYAEGNILMHVFPEPDEGEQKEVTMTWGWDLDVLAAVRNFVDAYPGLYVGWRVVKAPEGWEVGSGLLTSWH